MENYSHNLDAAFAALSDATRRAVLTRLVEGEATVKELAKPFPLGLPTFLKHLRVLEESGLITSRKTGRVRTCSLVPQRLEEVESWLAKRRIQLETQIDQFANYVETLNSSEIKK